jgi:hypothetical protein
LVGCSVAGDGHSEVLFDVDVCVVGDVVDDLQDLATGPLERRHVLGADRIAAVVADAEALAGECVHRSLGPDLGLAHFLVVDVQLERAVPFPELPLAVLRELDADDVPTGAGRGREDALLGRYADEVVGEGERPVFDEQRRQAAVSGPLPWTAVPGHDAHLIVFRIRTPLRRRITPRSRPRWLQMS